MTRLGIKGTWALVAGGSKGIGFALAEALARRGYNLVLVARQEDALQAAKQNLESKYGVGVEILAQDLSEEQAAQKITTWCLERNFRINVLCNVAGFGGSEDFPDLPPEGIRYMIRLNLGSAAALCQLLLPELEKNSPSYILNVASMAAFAPIPIKNMYAATKSGLLFFSLSLRQQLRSRNISVSCLAPGPVLTRPEIAEETRRQLGAFGMRMALEPHRVGEIAIRKMFRGKPIIVPGMIANTMAGLIRVLPVRVSTALYSLVGK